jgi:hypothetical protein
MAKMVVATWNRQQTMYDQRGLAERLNDLKQAVQLTDDKMRAQNYDSDGFIKAIFAAPEYLFARKAAGAQWNGSAWEQGLRSYSQTLRDQVFLQLEALSKRYPRILIIPGTITWLPTVTEKQLNKLARAYMYYLIQAAAQIGIHYDANFWVAAVRKFFKISSKDFAALSNEQIQNLLSRTSGKLLRYGQIGVDQRIAAPELPAMLAETAFSKTAAVIMRNTMYVMLNGKKAYKYDKHANYGECAVGLLNDEWRIENPIHPANVVFRPGIGSGTTVIEGIRFGFEVCMDHGLGTLSSLYRPGRDLPDIHVIVSDYVDFDDNNAVVRNGGYVIHASTHPDENAVFQKNPGKTAAPSLGSAKVGGTDLRFWEIDIAVNDGFTLAGTFMDPSRPRTQWAPVNTPNKPFRSGG